MQPPSSSSSSSAPCSRGAGSSPRGCSASTTAGRASSGASSARSSASPIACCGIDPAREQTLAPSTRAASLLFSAVGVALLYAMQRLQGHLPLNPAGLKDVRPDIAFNTAWRFVTNTNWQNYGAESTMSYLTQMAGLAVQNFVSAAVGMAVAVALIRGFARAGSATIGNFWADLVPRHLYILLPLVARARDRARLARRRPDLLAARVTAHDASRAPSR